MLNKFLLLLSGKKSVIATILTALNGYLTIKGIYGEAEFTLITVIIGTLFGAASYQTCKMYKTLSAPPSISTEKLGEVVNASEISTKDNRMSKEDVKKNSIEIKIEE